MAKLHASNCINANTAKFLDERLSCSNQLCRKLKAYRRLVELKRQLPNLQSEQLWICSTIFFFLVCTSTSHLMSTTYQQPQPQQNCPIRNSLYTFWPSLSRKLVAHVAWIRFVRTNSNVLATTQNQIIDVRQNRKELLLCINWISNEFHIACNAWKLSAECWNTFYHCINSGADIEMSKWFMRIPEINTCWPYV